MEAFQITDSLNFTVLPINNVTTKELTISFPVNSTNITLSINRPPKYGNIVVSTISKTAGLMYFHLKDLAIEQIFYRINNDTCDQDSFEFQARAENFDIMSQTWKPFQVTDTIIVINDPPIAIRELDLSLPPNSRDLRLYITRKPVCGNITVSTAKNVSGEQLHFILIEDPATERIFYQKNLHDSFEFIAVADDYFNESSISWEMFQTTGSFDVTILPYPRTTQEFRIPFPANLSNIRFNITKPPMYGNVMITTNRTLDRQQCSLFLKNTIAEHIFYQSGGSETFHDSFEFTASTEYFSDVIQSWELFEITDAVNITIIPINDNPPQFIHRASELHAVQGGSTLITSALFSANDSDSDMRDEDIVWRLRPSSTHGYMYLDVDPGRRDLGITNWTEGDLRAGRLYYKDNSDDSLDTFILLMDITSAMKNLLL